MRRFLLGLLSMVAVAAVATPERASASYCGAGRIHCCRCCTCCCCMQCCTVMKTCQEVVYEEQEQTFYKTVYEDVVEEKKVPCVKYVEETQYHCVPCTVMQPRPPAICAPVKPCGPCATEEMCPVQICRKVPYTVYRAVCAEQPVKVSRVVAKQVPYTLTICIPRVVTRQVPVQVCCPVPCCCKPCKEKCCEPSCSAECGK